MPAGPQRQAVNELLPARLPGYRVAVKACVVHDDEQVAVVPVNGGPGHRIPVPLGRDRPAASTAQWGTPAQDVWGWNYTTILGIIALAAFAGLYWLYRNRERLGGAGCAKDPVCGMQAPSRPRPGHCPLRRYGLPLLL